MPAQIFFSNYFSGKMTGRHEISPTKKIQRGLYVRFRTEMDWTGSN